MKHEDPRAVLLEAARELQLPLSEAQLDALLRFTELLRARAVPLGLISERDRNRILRRHVVDSLRAAVVVRQEDRRAYDLGSGAGLPGIPVAIARPQLSVEAVEAQRTRAAFLELARDELGLSNVTVRWARIEELSDPADLCFARALAPLQRSWEASSRLLVPGGRLIYFAGSGEQQPAAPTGAASVDLHSVHLLDSEGPLAIITL